MSDPRDRDINDVVHGLLAAALGLGSGAMLLFAVPALFNAHSSEGDLAALALSGGTIAFAYLGARYLWRSYTSTTGEEK